MYCPPTPSQLVSLVASLLAHFPAPKTSITRTPCLFAASSLHRPSLHCNSRGVKSVEIKFKNYANLRLLGTYYAMLCKNSFETGSNKFRRNTFYLVTNNAYLVLQTTYVKQIMQLSHINANLYALNSFLHIFQPTTMKMCQHL